jgi:hypothetical protein
LTLSSFEDELTMLAGDEKALTTIYNVGVIIREEFFEM